jgi:hypothetical protein
MEPLIDKSQLRSILERGLITGKWSILQFNRGTIDVTLPSREFLVENPVFMDESFRDLEAYIKCGHRGLL